LSLQLARSRSHSSFKLQATTRTSDFPGLKCFSVARKSASTSAEQHSQEELGV
jgi:hypothetical protein